MDTRAAQPLGVAEPRDDRPRRVRPGAEQADRGHRRRGCGSAPSRHIVRAAPPRPRRAAATRSARPRAAAGSRGSSERPRSAAARRAALRPLERPDQSQHLVRVRLVADPLPALGHPVEDRLRAAIVPGYRVRQAQQVAVRPAVAALVLDGLEARDGSPPAVVPARERPHQAAAPAAAAPPRTRRSGRGACRCAPRAAAPRTPRAACSTSPSFAASASAKSAGSFFGRAARVRDRDDPLDRPAAVGCEAAQDGLRVLARQLPLGRVVACRPRCRGSGSGRAASSRRPPRRSRRRCSAPGDVPGIGADCGVLFLLNHLLRYDMAMLLLSW